MNKTIWREKYPKDSFPAFPCPNCSNGVFKRLKDKSFSYWRSGPDEDTMETEGKFASFFQCSYGFCATVAVMSGVATSVFERYVDGDGEEQMGEEVYFYPKSMTPGPMVISIPAKTPKSVQTELKKAFSVIWTDRGSAVNKLRVAIEEMLVGFGIDKETAEGMFIPLAQRLDRFQAMQIGHHDTLLALKDLGNTGSHETMMPLKDLLDAFDILEDALEDIYGGRQARLAGIKQRFTKPRKPRASA
jgi:hypothetical protein